MTLDEAKKILEVFMYNNPPYYVNRHGFDSRYMSDLITTYQCNDPRYDYFKATRLYYLPINEKHSFLPVSAILHGTFTLEILDALVVWMKAYPKHSFNY